MFDAIKRKKWAKRAEICYTYSSLILMLAGLTRGIVPLLTSEYRELVELYSGTYFLTVAVVFAAAVVMLISWIAKNRLGPAAAWTTLQALCNKLQSEAFPQCKQRNDPIDDYRVTLFRHQKRAWRVIFNSSLGMNLFKRFCCFASGWLVPVIRSGDLSRGTKSVFRASKQDRGSKAEGIVGQAWARPNAVTVSDLPKVDINSSEEDIQTYARETYTKVERVKAYINDGKILSRSFWACRLKMQGGQEWGVIVLDSLSPDEIDKAKVEEAFKWISEAATELLKEVS